MRPVILPSSESTVKLEVGALSVDVYDENPRGRFLGHRSLEVCSVGR